MTLTFSGRPGESRKRLSRFASRTVAFRTVAALTAGFLAAGALTGCGLKTGSVYVADVQPGTIKSYPGLKDVQIVVGSKDFSEVQILGYISVIAMKAAGAEVVDRTNIKGSQGQRQAMLAGGIDLAWDYTGSAWIAYLGNTQPIPNSSAQYAAVKKADAKNGLTWTSLAPMSNQYALAVTAETQRKYHLRTNSDAANLIKKNPELGTFCIEAEFANRDDGLPGMAKTYGFATPPDLLRKMDLGLIYTQTAKGACTFGEVYTTDGRIGMLGLKVLNDDKHFFPIYNAAMTTRTEIFRAHPEIEKIFDPISARLTTAEISKLNLRVDVGGEEPSKVAMDWMVQQKFVRAPGTVDKRG